MLVSSPEQRLTLCSVACWSARVAGRRSVRGGSRWRGRRIEPRDGAGRGRKETNYNTSIFYIRVLELNWIISRCYRLKYACEWYHVMHVK